MPFAKGRSGNPGGKRQEKLFATALRMELKSVGDDQKRLRAIARKLLDEAEGGNLSAIREVADRLDGKPCQALEHGGAEGEPLVPVLNLTIGHQPEDTEPASLPDQ